ncbi:hypothetical protein MPH_11967 [Macrophomina phaseolina MS6]|uniref:Uncharacterized protein n=1 Tax=Macrophomina phaseolina (strain MS6) TaxID=1126212 RepID=K2RLE2_MACPH|nr:hypothetical protein MPH_11967 [Macrophomina phaseolina MS6]
MYQRFTQACRSFDTMVPRRLRSSEEQDQEGGGENLELEQRLSNEFEEKSLPRKPKAARLRHQSTVHSLLRRVHSNEVLTRFSASFATRSGPQATSSPIFAPLSFTHVQASVPLPPTPTASRPDYAESQPSFGSDSHQCKSKQDTPEPPSPIWVTVDCERCNGAHGPMSLSCTRTMIPAWPYDHPHPLRSNPWEQSRSAGLPSAFNGSRPWQHRRVCFLSNQVES